VVKENVYRFLALETNELIDNQAIYFGWYRDPEEPRAKTKFTYENPAGASENSLSFYHSDFRKKFIPRNEKLIISCKIKLK
jgi:hypothetical protein